MKTMLKAHIGVVANAGSSSFWSTSIGQLFTRLCGWAAGAVIAITIVLVGVRLLQGRRQGLALVGLGGLFLAGVLASIQAVATNLAGGSGGLANTIINTIGGLFS
jgi:hypothetical protein